MNNSAKYKIAKLICNGYYYRDDPTYDELIEGIYNNIYVTIYKVPINTLILGTIESFIINDLEHANMILSKLKDVIQDALEFSGTELTYTDHDWENLKIIVNPSQWGGKYTLSKNNNIDITKNQKSYMAEFFVN